MLVYVLLIFIQTVQVTGDYECLCNFHNSRLEIYNKPDNTSQALGTLQRFSCKPTYASGGQGMWKTIQYERQIGFVLTDSFSSIQICQGSPQNRDLVGALGTLITYNTTTLKTTRPRPSSTYAITPVPTMTMSSTPATTTSTTQTTATLFPQGDVSKCPAYVRNDATKTQSYLGQYDQYCFVLYPHATNWANAVKLCKLRGGQILRIRNATEQDFFTNYLKSHHYAESVYIGLVQVVKGGRYMWVSGAPVTYTNWAPDYYSPQQNHTKGTCVVMKANGQWIDAGCGLGLLLNIGHYDHETHHFICQYGFDARPTHIGSIVGKKRK